MLAREVVTNDRAELRFQAKMRPVYSVDFPDSTNSVNDYNSTQVFVIANERDSE